MSFYIQTFSTKLMHMHVHAYQSMALQAWCIIETCND